MTAYIVFTRKRTLDADELATYAKKAPAARGDHPLTALAFYGPLEVLEGDPIEGAVILSFPSVADAKAWYESPAYQDARQHRLKGADYNLFLIEGVEAAVPG